MSDYIECIECGNEKPTDELCDSCGICDNCTEFICSECRECDNCGTNVYCETCGSCQNCVQLVENEQEIICVNCLNIRIRDLPR